VITAKREEKILTVPKVSQLRVCGCLICHCLYIPGKKETKEDRKKMQPI
jgi:hypothetical protein